MTFYQDDDSQTCLAGGALDLDYPDSTNLCRGIVDELPLWKFGFFVWTALLRHVSYPAFWRVHVGLFFFLLKPSAQVIYLLWFVPI